MKKFKLHVGCEPSYEIERTAFETLTKGNPPYVERGKDGRLRQFAVCPACDNPIQLIGLYAKSPNSKRPYGKHYNKDASVATHNEQAYRFCPYASQNYSISKAHLREKVTEYERNIFLSVRDNFDLAIRLLEQELGIHIGPKFAAAILDCYLAGEGYRYYWATPYNIPWILFYFLLARPCYGLVIKENGLLWDFFSHRKDVSLKKSFIKDHYFVDNRNGFLYLKYSMILHKRSIVNDEVAETIEFQVFSDGDGRNMKTEKRYCLKIDETKFPDFVQKATVRDQKLLEIAAQQMAKVPEISG